jgi:hypothetical protein
VLNKLVTVKEEIVYSIETLVPIDLTVLCHKPEQQSTNLILRENDKFRNYGMGGIKF